MIMNGGRLVNKLSALFLYISVIYTLVLGDDRYDKLRVSYIIPLVAFKTGKIGSDVRLNDIAVLVFL